MAGVNAPALRAAAREAMLAAGGRGFMRFAPEGALLITDAPRRCEDDKARERLKAALEGAGFACEERDGLLLLTPEDGVLRGIDCEESPTDWDSALHGAHSLGLRWRAAPDLPLTREGRQLIVEALRLGWQGPEAMLGALGALRARAAVMQRGGDRSGLRQAGAVLLNACDEWEERI